jgi:hypothetical protein
MLSQMFVQPKTGHELLKSGWEQATSLQDPVQMDVTSRIGDFTNQQGRRLIQRDRHTVLV